MSVNSSKKYKPKQEKKKKKKREQKYSKKNNNNNIFFLWAGLTLEMSAGGSYPCFILMSEGLEMYLPQVCPKDPRRAARRVVGTTAMEELLEQRSRPKNSRVQKELKGHPARL